MSDLATIRALIDRAKTDSRTEQELEDIHCLLLAWQGERSRGTAAAWTPGEIPYACTVRFAKHEVKELRLLAFLANVPAPIIAQRLVTQALADQKTADAAVQACRQTAATAQGSDTAH